MEIKIGTPVSTGNNSEGWGKVKEPFESFLAFYAVAIIIGIFFLEVLRAFYDAFPFYKYLYLVLLILPIHELLHAVVFPKCKNSIIWINFKKLLFCVTNDSVISKTKLILMLLMPFVVLTIIPFGLSFYFELEILKYIVVYNALCSGGDAISLFAILKDKNKYYKLDGNDLYGAISLS